MDWLFSVLLTIHTLVALAIIGLVLMQHGKGADMGAAFGSGASGSANFLSRTTAILTAVFFASSLTLTYLASEKSAAPQSLMESAPALSQDKNAETQKEVPSTPQGENAIPE